MAAAVAAEVMMQDERRSRDVRDSLAVLRLHIDHGWYQMRQAGEGAAGLLREVRACLSWFLHLQAQGRMPACREADEALEAWLCDETELEAELIAGGAS